MTMTVALGMSMPTSMTVVATSTSISPSRSACITRRFSSAGSCPCTRPRRRSGKTPRRRSNSAVAEAASSLSLSSTSGQTTKACRPRAACSRTRAYTRSRSPAPLPTSSVATPGRWAGISSSTDTSRSPYRVIDSVRGMGVAVMMSRSGCGPSAFSRRLTRWCTPKRCCSSTTARPRRAKRTPSWMRAWVPTTTSTVPSAVEASTPARSGDEEVSRAIRTPTRRTSGSRPR